jgi:hypothetical protein
MLGRGALQKQLYAHQPCGTLARVAGWHADLFASELVMSARRITLRVQPPNPFGEVTMVPATLSGRPEADTARAMVAAFADSDASSSADILNRLRHSFPLTPLSERVAALSVIMDRLRHAF